MLLSCWPLVIWISSFIFFIMLKLLPEENFCVLCTNMHKFDFDFKQRTSCLFNIPFKYLQICALLVLLWCYSFFFFFDRISCLSGWPWTTDPSSFRLLKCWNDRHMLPCLEVQCNKVSTRNKVFLTGIHWDHLLMNLKVFHFLFYSLCLFVFTQELPE